MYTLLGIFLILFVLGIIVLGLFAMVEDDYALSMRYIKGSVACVIVTLFCFSLMIFIQININNLPYICPKEPRSVEHIVALQDSSEVNGEFKGNLFVTRGYINEKLYYSYLVDVGNGGMKANKVPADKTTIYEAEDNFRVEWYECTKEFWGTKETELRWKIYIPEGSITDDFSIDLQ